jgi:hypothetical protein
LRRTTVAEQNIRKKHGQVVYSKMAAVKTRQKSGNLSMDIVRLIRLNSNWQLLFFKKGAFKSTFFYKNNNNSEKIMLVNKRKNNMLYSILLTCKRIMLLIIILSFFGACSTQRHRPKPPKRKRCDCPHFTQELFINNLDNYTDGKLNG